MPMEYNVGGIGCIPCTITQTMNGRRIKCRVHFMHHLHF